MNEDTKELPIVENQVADSVNESSNPDVSENARGDKSEKKSVREHIKEAVAQVKEKNTPDAEKVDSEVPKTGRESDLKLKNAVNLQKEALNPVEKPVKNPIAPHQNFPAEIKAEWAKLDPKVQTALVKREADFEKLATTMDEERSFAKEMQKTILPYMPLINMSQSTPAKAITELLNYAQILQTGSPQSKGQLLHQLAQRWGADMRFTPQVAQQPQNQFSALQQELQRLREQVVKQPELIKQQQEQANLQAVIEAFAADPKNIHYARVKPVMAALLSSGQAKDMQDAYDKACYAEPDIRSERLAADQKAVDAKRIADIKAKAEKARSASVSVKGSSSMNGADNPKVKRSLREELRANLRSAQA